MGIPVLLLYNRIGFLRTLGVEIIGDAMRPCLMSLIIMQRNNLSFYRYYIEYL